jgi:hypothetical protein
MQITPEWIGRAYAPAVALSMTGNAALASDHPKVQLARSFVPLSRPTSPSGLL